MESKKLASEETGLNRALLSLTGCDVEKTSDLTVQPSATDQPTAESGPGWERGSVCALRSLREVSTPGAGGFLTGRAGG